MAPQQQTIFDALDFLAERNPEETPKRPSRRQYQIKFVNLTKLLVDDLLTFDEYKLKLHTLMEQYRKDYHNVK